MVNQNLEEANYQYQQNQQLFEYCINNNYQQGRMFGCFCGPRNRKQYLTITRNSKHYRLITEKLTDNEILMLQLIYQDLANRDNQKTLTQQNFLQYFNLSGLWAYKLFRQFDENGEQAITGEQFLLGMSMIIKSSLDDKIRLLYNLFQGDQNNGISFKKFTKMLYNFSKDQLKEILLEDGVFVEEVVIPIQVLESIAKQKTKKMEKSVVELDFQSPINSIEQKTSFDHAYQDMFDNYNDQGTLLQFKTQRLTYKIRYCNMITLVRQFASHVFKKYQVDNANGKLSFHQFREWIQMHMKLFNFYYASFHHELWAYIEDQPLYLVENKVEKQFEGRIKYEGEIKNIFGLLVDEALIICETRQSTKRPNKVICLTGLTIKSNIDKEGYGMSINHTSDHYKQTIIYFNTKNEQIQWIQHLKIYEENTLHKRYIVLEEIGTGKFSVVYKCQERLTEKHYALKMIELSKLTEDARLAISNESHIMQVVEHPQIIRYKETIVTKTHIYLILEYVEGCDLREYVRKHGPLEQHQCAFIIGQIIKAVNFLHCMDIVHRDIKPQNIMVKFKKLPQGSTCSIQSGSSKDKRYLPHKQIETVKIIDFGFALHISQLLKLPQQKICFGTPNYIAPETLIKQKPTFKIDNFAIGSLMYFLLSGKEAFQGQSTNEILINTVRCQLNLEKHKWKTISEEAKDLIRKLLQRQPQERIQLEQSLNHQWFATFMKRKKEIKIIKNNSDFQQSQQVSNSRRRRRSSLQIKIVTRLQDKMI